MNFEIRKLLPEAVHKALSNFPETDLEARAKSKANWNNKTKPAGSLGRLEEIVSWLAGVRKDAQLIDNRKYLYVYAGSHGIANQGVSAFPSEVNAQMLANFEAEGAAINAICQEYNINFKAWNTGIENPTGNIATTAAMTKEEMVQGFMLGWSSVPEDATLFALGEMGIGNTSIATALACIVLKQSAFNITGAGTGITEEQKKQKAKFIDQAINLHKNALHDPWERMCCLGGKELAAICGALLRATSLRIPVVLDGLIVTAAASIAFEIQPKCLSFCIAGHCSEEPAHAQLLKHFNLEPILNLNMRLGEGSGSAMAIGVINGALSCYRNMATFESAGVSTE